MDCHTKLGFVQKLQDGSIGFQIQVDHVRQLSNLMDPFEPWSGDKSSEQSR